MGMRGPGKTPLSVLSARGSWRAAGRKSEMSGRVCLPKCPEWVTDEAARKLYRSLGRKLVTAGVMTEYDCLGLAMLCNAFHNYKRAKEMIDAEGIIMAREHGGVVAHPAVVVMNQSWDRVVKLCREYGLTPSARSGIQVGSIPNQTNEGVDEGRFFKTGS